jgi:two-component system, NarL family, nitrate/nitrite response regulator NarL
MVGVGPSLLIVDDHAGFRSFARALFEAEGYHVVGEAAGGESALAEARRLAISAGPRGRRR